MSTLAGDISFDFAFPSCEPSTPPNFAFDPSLLEIPYHAGHCRSSSRGSVYSVVSSTVESTPDTVSTRMSTPSRASPPVRQHGPILLPKIRSQDQAIESPPKRVKTLSPPPAQAMPERNSSSRTSASSHARSFTNPETLSWCGVMPPHFASQPETMLSSSLLCSPVIFAEDDFHPRRASTCSSLDDNAIEKFGFPTYRQMPAYVPAPKPAPAPASSMPRHQPPSNETLDFSSCAAYGTRAPSPLSLSATPEPVQTTTLFGYLTAPNPAPSLVRTVSFPLRDPHTKHFWWDVRQVRPWTAFSTSNILSLPGATALLNCPVPTSLLPAVPAIGARHPENEAALHQMYASHYLPRLNAALCVSSTRPLQLSVASKSSSGSSSPSGSEPLFIATAAGDAASAAALFGGKPSARAVGLVRSFDRFNTGMRVEGNVKRVEYLRGLAAIHHAMREHGCRYGFIVTEIELVVVRNGAERTPHFGFVEVAAVQLAAAGFDTNDQADTELTACMALWGLCMMAGDEAVAAGAVDAHWRAEIGAPAEGSRRKALARDNWMPQPQLAEKREAKRSRGWVWPEDPVGRKELGKRGVRYGGC